MNSLINNDTYNLPPSPPSESPVSPAATEQETVPNRKRKTKHSYRVEEEEESETLNKKQKPGESVPKYKKNPAHYTGAERRSVQQAINMHKHHEARDEAFKENPFLKETIKQQQVIIYQQKEKNDQQEKTIVENKKKISEDKKTIEEREKTIRELMEKIGFLESKLETERENKQRNCADFDAEDSFSNPVDVPPIFPDLEFA